MQSILGRMAKKKDAEKHNHLQKVAGIWSRLAINQNQTNTVAVYRDERDTKRGFNCVVPYGEWEGGDLLLWEIRQRISLQQGEAVFFRGNIISHNAWIIKGVRNYVDCLRMKTCCERIQIREDAITMRQKEMKSGKLDERMKGKKRGEDCTGKAFSRYI